MKPYRAIVFNDGASGRGLLACYANEIRSLREIQPIAETAPAPFAPSPEIHGSYAGGSVTAHRAIEAGETSENPDRGRADN